MDLIKKVLKGIRVASGGRFRKRAAHFRTYEEAVEYISLLNSTSSGPTKAIVASKSNPNFRAKGGAIARYKNVRTGSDRVVRNKAGA